MMLIRSILRKESDWSVSSARAKLGKRDKCDFSSLDEKVNKKANLLFEILKVNEIQ